MAHHDLNSDKRQFKGFRSRKKKAMIRLNDRAFSVGDSFTLYEGEFDEGKFKRTGATESGIFTDIDDYGCQHGMVMLSCDQMGLTIVHKD